MAARRITRKEMRRDDFVTAVGKFSLWLEEHAREAVIGIGVLAALVVGSILFVQYLGRREEKASALLAHGLDVMHAPVRGVDAANASPGSPSHGSEEEKYRATLEQMDAVLQTYPRSRAARLARYYKGLALLHLGKPREAADELETFLAEDPGGFAAPMARAALAGALEASGEREKALKLYEDLARSSNGPYPPPAALMEMGLALERMGKKDEARKVYERITREYPESDYSQEASERLKQLS